MDIEAGKIDRVQNPPIPTRPCFKCGVPTNETQSIHGVGHYKCFKEVDDV